MHSLKDDRDHLTSITAKAGASAHIALNDIKVIIYYTCKTGQLSIAGGMSYHRGEECPYTEFVILFNLFVDFLASNNDYFLFRRCLTMYNRHRSIV